MTDPKDLEIADLKQENEQLEVIITEQGKQIEAIMADHLAYIRKLGDRQAATHKVTTDIIKSSALREHNLSQFHNNWQQRNSAFTNKQSAEITEISNERFEKIRELNVISSKLESTQKGRKLHKQKTDDYWKPWIKKFHEYIAGGMSAPIARDKIGKLIEKSGTWSKSKKRTKEQIAKNEPGAILKKPSRSALSSHLMPR